MSKEITKAYIIQELTDKFKLREDTPEKFLFLEGVRPVYNIEEHLKDFSILSVTRSVTGIGGVYFSGPGDTKKWELNGYTIVFLSGAFTVSGAYITRNSDSGKFVYLDLTAAQSVSYTVNLPKSITMYPGDRLSINVDGYTSTGDLRMDMDVSSETIR